MTVQALRKDQCNTVAAMGQWFRFVSRSNSCFSFVSKFVSWFWCYCLALPSEIQSIVWSGLVFKHRNSSQFIAELLWEITEGENDFGNRCYPSLITHNKTTKASPMNYDM